MKRSEVDLQKGIWNIPAERYKTKVAHTIPLSPAAITILLNMAAIGEYFFTTTGDKPFSGFGKAKRQLDENVIDTLKRIARDTPNGDAVTRIPPWRIHDLRRTAKTLMIRRGIRPDISERILGHTIPGVEGTYDRHTYLEERKHAAKILASEVQNILDRKTENIVQLSEKRTKR